MKSTVGDTCNHLERFFATQGMAALVPKHIGQLYGVFTLTRSMYFQKPPKGQTKLQPDDDEDKTALDPSTKLAAKRLIEYALEGQPLPETFLTVLAARNRAEKRVTRPRAALTKMVLLSRAKEFGMDEHDLTHLDEGYPSAAYHLGRLLAVLDDIQHAVMPKVNTSLVDRFYGSMSTTPYAVMGRLIGSSQAHLQKLRKENRLRHDDKQALLQSVMVKLRPGELPQRPLTIREQSLFSLGYYHQKAALAEQMRDRRDAIAARKAETAAQNDNATQNGSDTDAANEGDPSHE